MGVFDVSSAGFESQLQQFQVLDGQLQHYRQAIGQEFHKQLNELTTARNALDEQRGEVATTQQVLAATLQEVSKIFIKQGCHLPRIGSLYRPRD